MKISDIKSNQGKVDIEAAVIEKGEVRDINKYGKNLRVATAVIKDESGKIKLSLWNNEIDNVNVGDKIKISNGYASEFKGEKQLTAGKFGKLEVVGKASEEEMKSEASEEVRTNMPPQQESVPGITGTEEDSSDDSDEEW